MGTSEAGIPSAAVAVMASGTVDSEIAALVEALRANHIDASAFDVGSGVVLLNDVFLKDVDSLLSESSIVERVVVPDTKYRLVRRELAPNGSIVKVGGVSFGADEFVVVAGPCAVESRDQLFATARAVLAAGANVLRGGAYKPRTNPYAFQGLGLHGVELLAEARQITGLPFVTEVMDSTHIEPMYELVDGFQVGARNMQNYELLKALSRIDKPVLLKRGAGATVEEWLLAAEYLLSGGNSQVVMCERGIRTFNSNTRFTLDLAAVAHAKRETHLPVIADPSHATGRPELVSPMAQAALGAGADGVMVEVHPDPDAALSDGFQALSPKGFDSLMRQLETIAAAAGRPLAESSTAILGRSEPLTEA